MKDRAYTKSRLLKELAYKVGVKKVLSQKILDALAEIIYREAGIGGFVLPGVCKFDVVERKVRRIRNPRTGEVLVLPPHRALRATLSNIAKRAVAPRPKAMPLAEYEASIAAAQPAAEPVVADSAGSVPNAAGEAVKPISVKPPTGEVPVRKEAVAEGTLALPVVQDSASAPADKPQAVEPKAEEPPAAPPAEARPAEPKAEEPPAAPPAEAKPVEPKAEEPPAAPPAEARPAEPKAEEPPAAPGGPISFRCSGCGQEIEAPAEAVGFEAECPMCGRIVVVPKKSEPGTMYGPVDDASAPKSVEPVVSAKEAEEMDPAALKNRTIRIDATLLDFDDEYQPPPRRQQTQSQPTAEEKLVSFFCKKCHQEIEATTDMCGSQGECPNCGVTFVVPYFSDSGSVHDDSAEAQRRKQANEVQKHSTMRINLDEF